MNSTMSVMNTSAQAQYGGVQPCRMVYNESYHISSTVISLLVISLNTLILYMFICYGRLRRTVSNFLLVSLATSDLTSGVLMFLLTLPYLYLHFSNCTDQANAFRPTYYLIVDLFTQSMLICSILHLLLLSSERFVSMYYALRYAEIVTRTRVTLVIFCAWSTAFVAPASKLIWLVPYINNLKTRSSLKTKEQVYHVTFITLFCFLPTLVLTCQYLWLYNLIHRLLRTDRKRCSREVKVIVIYCTMFLCFIIFCTPYQVVEVLMSLDSPSVQGLSHQFYEAIFLMRFIISAINPLLYALYKKDFRLTLRTMLRIKPKTILHNKLSWHPTLEPSSFLTQISTNNTMRLRCIKNGEESRDVLIRKKRLEDVLL